MTKTATITNTAMTKATAEFSFSSSSALPEFFAVSESRAESGHPADLAMQQAVISKKAPAEALPAEFFDYFAVDVAQ